MSYKNATHDDEKMYANIRKLIEESRSDRDERLSRGKNSNMNKKIVTPYGITGEYSPRKVHPSHMSTSLFLSTSSSSHKDASKSSLKKLRGTSIPEDSLLRKYADELRGQSILPIPKDDLRVKAVTLTHMDTMSKVESFISINGSLNNKSNTEEQLRTEMREASSISIATSNVHPSTPFTSTVRTPALLSSIDDDGDMKDMQFLSYLKNKQKLKNLSSKRFSKKYPRYCSSLNFNDEELKAIEPRSDPWISKFIEICFDEALHAFNTPATHGRQVFYEDLNVGSLDAFPLLVQRIIGQFYSVLEIKKRVSLEVLYTIELLIEKSEFGRYKATYSDSVVRFDGGKALLFSRFMSEEYDVDVLAMFLYAREVIQLQLGRRLKDTNPSRIWVDDKQMQWNPALAKTFSLNLTTSLNSSPEKQNTVLQQSVSGDIKSASYKDKIVPYNLPPQWYFMLDVAMPESPLVTLHENRLAHLLHVMSPQFDHADKQYLISKIWDLTVFDMVTSDVCSKQMKRDRVQSVPVYCILRTLCIEWKKLSKEEKLQFSNAGQTFRTLRSLHEIYQNNCEMMKKSKEDIIAVEIELINIIAKIHHLEKELKKYERKWNRRLVADHQNEHNISKITELKDALAQAKFERIAKEQDQEKKIRIKEKLSQSIEVLWDKAMFKGLAYPGDNSSVGSDMSSINSINAKKNGASQVVSTTASKKPITSSTSLKGHDSKLNDLDETKMREADSENSNDMVLHPTVNTLLNSSITTANAAALWIQYIVAMLTKIVNRNNEQEALLKQSVKNTKQLLAGSINLPLPPSSAASVPSSTITPSPLPPPSMQAQVIENTIVQTVTRMFVRQVINEGKRRVLLKKHLAIQEHELSIRYGNLQYIQQYHLQLLAQAKLRKHQTMLSMIPSFSVKFVINVIESGKKNAFHALYNSWWWLEVEIKDLYENNSHMIQRINSMFRWKNRQLMQFAFSRLGLALKHKLLARKVNYALLKSCWIKLVALQEHQKYRFKQLLLLQHFMNICVWKCRNITYLFSQKKILLRSINHYENYHFSPIKMNSLCANYFRFWYHRKVLVKERYRRCIDTILDRNFLKTFYTWKHLYSLKKLAKMKLSQLQLQKCIRIQCFFRVCAAKQFVKRLKAHRVLRRFYKHMQHSKIWTTTLRYFRKEYENYQSLQKFIQPYFLKLIHLKNWRKLLSVNRKLYRLFYVFKFNCEKFFWGQWKKFSDRKTKYLTKYVIKIQRQYRRHYVQSYILHYYRWQDQFILLQAHVRGFTALQKYRYNIFYFRNARRIQCLARKYICRKSFYYTRIKAFHNAASENSYERCKYYIDKFPEFLNSIDENGNNALHNAAIHAAKRTMKLLVRNNLHRNEYNRDGFTPLHLVIMSNSFSPYRDDCFQYMLERGFDDDQLTLKDGKTCLLLAVEYKQHNIIKQLLLDGHDANVADNQQLSPLQVACSQGNAFVVNLLLENEARVNQIGYNGTYPVHDSVTGKNVEVLQLLLGTNQCDINVKETTYQQTALMWAVQYCLFEFVDLLLKWNATITDRDIYERNVVHYVAIANDGKIFSYLKEYDTIINFDDNMDYQGNTPLHLAAYYNAVEYTKLALHSGFYPSHQNHEGNQPSHIAAQNNHLEVLQALSEYDEHIGRRNYLHLTPLGLAKFSQAKDCQNFLEEHYNKIEIIDGRNAVGDIWWDKSVDMIYQDWEVSINTLGERTYINKKTKEVRDLPPTFKYNELQTLAKKNELPLKRIIEMVREDDLVEETDGGGEGTAKQRILTKHEYYLEYKQQKLDIAHLSRDYNYATIITKYARRKLAYMQAKRDRKYNKTMKVFKKFFKFYIPILRISIAIKKRSSAVKIQALMRGCLLRKHFFAPGTGRFYVLKKRWAWRVLRYKLWKTYQAYKMRCDFQALLLVKNMPQTAAEWEIILDKCKYLPIRKVLGIFEEYAYPKTRNIRFYRNVITNACSFAKPKKLVLYDEEQFRENRERKKYGATRKQIALVVKLQAMYRGFKVRTYYKSIEKAYFICQTAKEKYLTNPETDIYLYNYALFILVLEQNLDHARRLFLESLNRMQYKGPDVAFVLYSYAIFAMKSQDEDMFDIMTIIQRGKKAEERRYIELQAKLNRYYPGGSGAADDIQKSHYERILQSIEQGTFNHGKVYEIANTGFFRYAANTTNTGYAWENYAICRFLIYNDFNGAFDAFMTAFTLDADNVKLKENFDLMMTHYFGNDKDKKDAVVQERMQAHAHLDAEQEEYKRLVRERTKLRNTSAQRIKKWYKECKQKRAYLKFMESIRERMREKKESKSKRRRTNVQT